MKIKSIFLTFLAVLVFSACNNEALSPVPDAEGKVEGYLILNLVNPVNTRTSGSGNTSTDQGTTQENTINNLTVVFANSSGNILSVANPGITNKVSEIFRVEVGTYDVYALINNAIDIKVGQNIEQVITVAAAAEATSGYKSGSFFMVNKRNSSSEKAGIETTIGLEHTINSPAVVEIYVDRVACKISDETASPDISALVVAAGGLVDDVDVVGFAILNVNKKFNLIQTWNEDNGSGMLLSEEILSTPLYTGALVADNYFLNIGEYTTLTKDNGEITGITDNTVGKSDIFVKSPVYTTENRPTVINAGASGITSGRGETTGVIYKVQAKKGGVNAETFYSYNNELYSNIAEIQALPDFESQVLSTLNSSQLRALGINVYEDGVMYYSYFIRDPNLAHQYESENYYGVFRNSSYKLSINKISSLGDDVPGGAKVDPTEPGEPGEPGGPDNPPIDTLEAYIKVTIEVNPWIVNVIGIDF
jgi:hypothetical protein